MIGVKYYGEDKKSKKVEKRGGWGKRERMNKMKLVIKTENL